MQKSHIIVFVKLGSVAVVSALGCDIAVALLMVLAVSEKAAGEHIVNPVNKIQRIWD